MLLIALLVITSCTSSASDEAGKDNADSSAQLAKPTVTPPADAFSDLRDEARLATRVGDPRPPTYWALWNTCAEENRAETAEANGGRAAGWFLMDDLLENPGIQVGELPVASCEVGLAILEDIPGSGDETRTAILNLASALLAAELNLNVGAETCPIAEEALVGSHLVLSEVGFEGSDLKTEISSEVASAVPRLLELLEGYNSGQLCR